MYLHTSEEVRIQNILTDLTSFLYLNWRSTHRMLNPKENYANVDEQRARKLKLEKIHINLPLNSMLILTIVMES